MKPLIIIDLFCGAGGAAMGYHLACERAGIPHRIIGFDRNAQPDYPFDFVRGDALIAAYKYAHLADFGHASPPCQQHSQSTAAMRSKGKVYPNLIPATRLFLEQSGKPCVIENVPQAPVRPDIVLRGDAFGLNVIRKRHFELIGWWAMQPGLPQYPKGGVMRGDYCSVFGKGGYRKYSAMPQDWRPNFDQGIILATWRFAMKCPWMNSYSGLAESIPPAYTEYIFSQYLSQRN